MSAPTYPLTSPMAEPTTSSMAESTTTVKVPVPERKAFMEMIPRSFPYQTISKVQARILLCLDILVSLSQPCGYEVAELIPSARTGSCGNQFVRPNLLLDTYRACAMLNLDQLEDALPPWPTFHDVAQQAANDIAHWLHSHHVGSELKVVESDKYSMVKTMLTLSRHVKTNADWIVESGEQYSGDARLWYQSEHARRLAAIALGKDDLAQVTSETIDHALRSMEAPTPDGYPGHDQNTRLRDDVAIDIGVYLPAVHVATAGYLLSNGCCTPEHDLVPRTMLSQHRATYCWVMLQMMETMIQDGAFRHKSFESVPDVLFFIAREAGNMGWYTTITRHVAETLVPVIDDLVVNVATDADEGEAIQVARYCNPLAYDVIVTTAQGFIKAGVFGDVGGL